MTMLDKCARAAYEAHKPRNKPWELVPLNERIAWQSSTRAVLEALRDPTPEMVEEGVEHWHPHENFLDTEIRGIFTAMIDEALASLPDDVSEAPWQPIETAPKDGKPMAAQDWTGKLHIVHANSELDRSRFVCWSRPAAIRGGAHA